MTDINEIFSVKRDTIDLDNIDSLISLSKFHPRQRDKFLNGLLLAKDLVNDKGVTLYTQGTKISPDRVARLVNIVENNPQMGMDIKIQRSNELIESFRKELITAIAKIISYRKSYKIYLRFIGYAAPEFMKLFKDLLSNVNILLNLYKLKFCADNSGNKNAVLLFNHALNTALFAAALARSGELSKDVTFTPDDAKEIIKTALFMHTGAIINNKAILDLSGPERIDRFYESNRESKNLYDGFTLREDAETAMNNAVESYFGKNDFIHDHQSKSSWMSNILMLIDRLLQYDSGLLGIKKKPSHIVDLMNVQMLNNKLNRTVVKALTLSLNLKDIFDFYQELDLLKSMCTEFGGGHAWPYPLTGFKSPTLFVCKGHHMKCEYYESSLKAVKLVQALDELEEGKYARCMLTTPKLIQFYQTHYTDIKNIENSEDE